MNIQVFDTKISEVKVIVPDLYKDDRGTFMEVYRQDIYKKQGLPTQFVQMNKSVSTFGTLRGLHFQWDPPMGKLIWVSFGEGFLVAVDIRKNSPTCGSFVSIISSPENREMLYAPAYFARGFLSLSDKTELEYLATGTYSSNGEGNILWKDEDIGINWPLKDPVISSRDENAPSLKQWLESDESNNFVQEL